MVDIREVDDIPYIYLRKWLGKVDRPIPVGKVDQVRSVIKTPVGKLG